MEVKKYTGSLRAMILRIFRYGLVLSGIFSLAAVFLLAGIPGSVAWAFYRIFRWPSAVVSGMILGTAVVLSRRTVVEIRNDEIMIRTAGSKKHFRPEQFVDSSILRKTHILSYSKYTTVKCDLIFEGMSGRERCRLYGFGEKELETVLAAIRSRQADGLTDEEKSEIVREYENDALDNFLYGNENENEFLLTVSELIGRERACLKKISLIMLCTILVIVALVVWELMTEGTFTVQLLFLTAAAFAMVMILLVLYVGLGYKRRICADKIVIGGNHLRAGGRYYAYSAIWSIRMTSPRKRSSSIFPVQHYMYVRTAEGKEKYWLGSEVSFAGYDGLCRMLEHAMVRYPDKVKYV